MSKWDGFSAFDSEKWDMKYKRGAYKEPFRTKLALPLALIGLALSIALAISLYPY